MSLLKKITTSLVLIAMVFSVSPTMALTFTEVVNLLQAPDLNLPTGVTNPKGNIGFILSELFWGTADGTKNGKIKPQYLDYSGISAWTQSGTITYLTVSTGSVGIGTSNPGGYAAAIRGIDDTATAGALWVSGQTATTPGLMVRNDGNVGIGTASPLALFEVNSGAILRFMGYGSLQLDKMDLNDTSPAFKIQNTAGTQFLRVQHNGNVGIGTASPAVKLDISGQMRVYGASSQITTTGTNGNDAQIYMVTDANARGFYIDNDDANKLKFYTGYGKGVAGKEVTFDNEGNVGIGTTSPIRKLSVSSNDGLNVTSSAGYFVNLNYLYGTSLASLYALDSTSAPTSLVLNPGGGNVGIGITSAPTYKLQLPNIGSAAGQGQANAWVTYSDGRVKTNKIDIGYGVSDIMKMTPKQYFHHSSEFKSGSLVIKSEGVHTIGFIAQDLQKVIPEAVNKPKNDSKELWSVDYNKLVPVLVNAMKEQQRQIERLTDEVRELKKR